MKNFNEKIWEHIITGCEGRVYLFGVNIFDYTWKRISESVKVLDPLYGQEFVFPIYTVLLDNKPHKFAAGEFSNGVWGFYTLK